MQLQFVGCGDAFGSGGRFNTCFHVTGERANFLIDRGASLLIAMKKLGIRRNDIQAVFVTHQCRSCRGPTAAGRERLPLRTRFSAERPQLVFDIPGGGEVYAENNFWRDGRPETQFESGGVTRVVTTRPRVDPLTPEDGQRQYMAIKEAHRP